MTDRIEFSESEAEFGFRINGVSYHVRTEVGGGPARVLVTEKAEHEEPQMEPEGDE